jgi:ABC-type sugar transport system permease subunit
LLVGLGLGVPVILGFIATFTNYAPGARSIAFVGGANYARFFTDPEFTAAVRNVLVLTVASVAIELGLALVIAGLLRRPFTGRRVVRVLLLVPWLISPIGAGVMWHFLFGSNGGLLDFVLATARLPPMTAPTAQPGLALATVIGIEVWRTAPLAAFLLLPAIERIPSERWDDARLEGAGAAVTLRHVVLPSVRPLLAAVGLLLVGLGLGTFDSVLILTGGGPGTATMTPALYAYQHAFGSGDWASGTAAAWLVVVGVAIAGAIYVRIATTGEGG